MSIIGVLIETDDDGVKEANFGVITAARRREAVGTLKSMPLF